MLRYFLASLVLFSLALADASAQTKPRTARKKIAPYSSRGARKPAVKINPHTGKPYGAGVPQDLKDGTYYLAPEHGHAQAGRLPRQRRLQRQPRPALGHQEAGQQLVQPRQQRSGRAG